MRISDTRAVRALANRLARPRARIPRTLLIAGALLALFVVPVLAQVGGSFDLSWNSIDGGGSTSPSTGGSYGVSGTVGQPDAGSMSGGQYTLNGGFWAAAVSTPTPTATNTPVSTATATSTPAPSGVVIGHVTWQGISQPNSRNSGITATLSLCVGGVAQNYPVSTDASGFFTATTGLPDGTYNWLVKGVINLASSGGLTITGGTSNQEMGTMRAGDSNNSNTVTSIDFNILKNTFGKSQGQTGYDGRADFNRDQVVSSTDFNLLKNNFGQSGATLTCP